MDVIADDALARELALTCVPPPPAQPGPYGDLVPLGFVLRALDPSCEAAARVRAHLDAQRKGVLWPYHRGGLVTATDSALVLLGMQDAAAIDALERFADGHGGYVPQLWSADPREGEMPRRADNRHWCQADFGTTALVRALQGRGEGRAWLDARFDSRGALYFANPYLLDWFLAMALRDDDRLAAEILGSVNADGTFGAFDVPFSTALAVLALDALGVGGEIVTRARELVSASIESDGRAPVCTPFYSSLIVPREELSRDELLDLALMGEREQHVWVNATAHAVSLYVDEARMIATAVASLALECGNGVAAPDPKRQPALPHSTRRYRLDRLAYIREVALPPYVSAD